MPRLIKLRDPRELSGGYIAESSVNALPIYSDTTGIYNFYAPQKSGKTVLAAQVCGNMLRRNKNIVVVYCFCPVPRREWKQLESLCKVLRISFRFVLKNHDVAMMALLELREQDYRKKRNKRIMVVWDDMMSVVNMQEYPWDSVSRTMACKARHEEVNIIWVVLSQDPTACVPIIRDNSTMSFFSNCSKRAIEHIMDAMSDDIDLMAIRLRAHSYQFICYHHHLKKIFCTKALNKNLV